jgi:hypothetical protein
MTDSLPTPTESLPAILSIRTIAERLDRHYTSVNRAIEKLGIQPAATSGSHKFYSPSVVQSIRDAMRRPNSNKPNPSHTTAS